MKGLTSSGLGLSAVVIALNESSNIEALLENLSFCSEVIVVDSGSRDQTASMARRLGARVFERPFDNFSSQKNFGISCASGDWILLVDADERITPELKAEILSFVKSGTSPQAYVRRRNKIFGRWMKNGASANDWQLRLSRKDGAEFTGLVHERIKENSEAVRLKSDLLHYSTRCVKDYMGKLISYTELEATQRILTDGKKSRPFRFLRPAGRFFKLGILERGFLDGWEGFAFIVLSAYYEFVKTVKIWEKSR